jgi:hypothetical protein
MVYFGIVHYAQWRSSHISRSVEFNLRARMMEKYPLTATAVRKVLSSALAADIRRQQKWRAYCSGIESLIDPP